MTEANGLRDMCSTALQLPIHGYILYPSFYHYVMHHYVILRHLWVYKVFILCVASEFARSESVSEL